MAVRREGAGAQRRRVRTAPARSAGARALKARGIGLAWGEGAPIPAALRADAHCTCCGSTQAFPERSRMMMSGPPLPTLALGRSAKRALHRASRAARSARRPRHPYQQEAMRASFRGAAHVGARARSAHAFGAERVARGGEKAAAGARARSAHALGGERVARGGDGSQRLRRFAHRRAAPSARSAERRARSARRRSGSPQAPGAQRPRHRRRARSARRRQLACWRSQHTLGGLCLLANSKKKRVSSPGPGPLLPSAEVPPLSRWAQQRLSKQGAHALG